MTAHLLPPDYGAVLSRLERLRPSPRPGTWTARCPVHEDRSPSLSLWLGRDGRLMANCWACRAGWRAVVRALGTAPGQWFPPREGRPEARPVIAAAYTYRAEDGAVLYQQVRFVPKAFRYRRPDGRGGWLWGLGDVEPVPYRLPELLAAPGQPVCVAEGEKDVDNLRAVGLVATTNPGGAGKWRLDYGRWLAGRRVAVLAHNDEPGRDHALQVAASLLFWEAASVRLVCLPGLGPGGDISDWLAAYGPSRRPDARRDLCALIRDTPEWKLIRPRKAP